MFLPEPDISKQCDTCSIHCSINLLGVTAPTLLPSETIIGCLRTILCPRALTGSEYLKITKSGTFVLSLYPSSNVSLCTRLLTAYCGATVMLSYKMADSISMWLYGSYHTHSQSSEVVHSTARLTAHMVFGSGGSVMMRLWV